MPCPQEFFDAYVTTALWSSHDNSDPETGGDPMDANYGPDDIAEDTREAMRTDCDAFYDANAEDLNCAGVKYGPDFGQDGRAGHDFWLTRNGHGAGFWDGDWPEPQATRLTAACGWRTAFPEVDLYVGDDGKIYAM